MSDLRDARLRRALEEAPDADVQADPRTRRAILDAARQAIAPRVSWWQRLWQGLGQRNMGWNAALATVLMTTVVTALWYERGIPGARPEPDVSQSRAPEPAAQRAPAPPAAPSAAAPARKPAAPAAKPQPRSPPAPVQSQRSAESRERGAEAAVDAMRDQAVREELAKSAPAPAAPQAMSRAAPAAGLASRAESPVATDWTHARIAVQGHSAEFSREQVAALAELLDRLARETHTQEPLQAKADTRIELTRGGAPAGAIELAGPQLRWIRPGGNSFTTRPEAAQLQALREELSRLLQR